MSKNDQLLAHGNKLISAAILLQFFQEPSSICPSSDVQIYVIMLHHNCHAMLAPNPTRSQHQQTVGLKRKGTEFRSCNGDGEACLPVLQSKASSVRPWLQRLLISSVLANCHVHMPQASGHCSTAACEQQDVIHRQARPSNCSKESFAREKLQGRSTGLYATLSQQLPLTFATSR